MRYIVKKGVYGGLIIDSKNKSCEQQHCVTLLNQKFNLSKRLNENIIKKQVKNLSQLTFEMTERCNLSCKYCAFGKYYHFSNKRDRQDIKWEIINSIFDFVLAQKQNNSSLHISFYGGEPLIKINLIKKTIEYCNNFTKKKIYFTYGLTTNGLLIKKHIDFLVKNDFNILISFDGDKYSNSFRVFKNGKESFDSVYQNINYVKEYFPFFFKKNISFNAVLHQRNSISEITEFFKNNFNKNVNISSLSINELSPLYHKDFMNNLYNNYYKDFNKNINIGECDIKNDPYISSAIRFFSNYNSFRVKNYNNLLQTDINKKLYIPTATCLPFSKKMFITARGLILPCERINYKYYLGKVGKNKISLIYGEIVKKYNVYYNKISKQCNICAYNDNCQVCMFDTNLSEEEPKCPSFSTKEQVEKDYSKIISYLENNPDKLKNILYETYIAN